MSAKKVFVNVHMDSEASTARTQSAKTIAHFEVNACWQTRKRTVLLKQNATVRLGFEGDDCSIRQCPSDCHNTDKVDRGVCDSGICHCKQKYAGDDCSLFVGIKGKGRGPISAESLISAFHMYRYLRTS